MSRSLFLRNIFSQYARYFLPVGIAIFLTPFLLHRLGDTAYGIYVLAGSFAALFSIIDLGLDTAIARFTAEYDAQKKKHLVGRLLAAGLLVTVATGLVGLMMCIGFARYVVRRYDIPEDLQFAAMFLIILNGLTFFFSKPTGLLAAALHGLKRFDIANSINMTWSVFHAIAIFVSVGLLVTTGNGQVGNGLKALGILAVIHAVLSLISYRWALHRVAPYLKLEFRNIQWREFRAEIRFAGWTMVDSMGSQLTLEIDPIVIGRLADAATVTPYAIGSKLPLFLLRLVNEGGWVLMPYLTTMSAEKLKDGQRQVLIYGTKYLLAVLLPLLVFLWAFAPQLLEWWVGGTDPVRVDVMRIFCVTVLVWCCDVLPVVMLYSIGRVKNVALIFLAEAGAKLILGIILFQFLGLTGMAAGACVAACVTCLCVLLPWTCRHLELPFRTFLSKAVLPQTVPMLVWAAVITTAVIALQGNFSRLTLAATAAGAGAIYIVAYWFFSVTQEERAIISDHAKNWRGR